MRKVYENTTSIAASRLRQSKDDEYYTKNHAWNNGLFSLFLGIAASVMAVVWTPVPLDMLWKLIATSVAGSLCVVAVSLRKYTHEARIILWETHLPLEPVEVQRVHNDEPEQRAITLLPQPRRRGSIAIGVSLTQSQLEQIAKAIRKHGKLTINFLVSIGLSRAQSESLREQLAAHELAYFDQDNQLIVSDDGRRTFKKILNDS